MKVFPRLVFVGMFLFCVASRSSAATPWQEPVDFRGIKWGAASDEAEVHIKEQWKRRREAGEIIVNDDIHKIAATPPTHRIGSFIFKDKIGGIPVDLILYFLDDKFVYANVYFKTEFFRTLEDAFKERYGAPTVEAAIPLQTRAGAKYVGKELKWIGPTMRISLNQYSSKITDGAASIGKNAYLEHLAERSKSRSGAAAKDL